MANVSADALRSAILAYSHGSDHPDLKVYRRDVDHHDWERFVWKTRHMAQLANLYGGKRALEVGCGFGWDAVALSLETDATIVAMDILPSMVDGMEQCLTAMKAEGRNFTVEPLVGDICTLDLPDGSFDAILSNEAVEHVHSLEAMYDRCFKLLKPGGRLVIVNDSNAYNSAFRERNFAMWEERDASWDHANWLKAEVRPVEHANAEPYGAMRERMIRAAAPDLDDAAVAKLVYATAGLTKPEIEQATTTFKANGSLPTRPAWSWCRNPETGEYAERLLDPFAIAAGLRAAGFRAHVEHFFRKFPFRLLNRIGIEAIDKILFERNPVFAIVAEKPKR